MDGLHRNIFATTERGALPDVMTRALHEELDALSSCRKRRSEINKKNHGQPHFAGPSDCPLQL